MQATAAPASKVSDTRPLKKAIVGTWSSGVIKVTFSADGRVTTELLGTNGDGHWSIDSSGRLRSDITGQQGATDARVAANELTITAEEVGLTFTRDDGA